ncbi:hypothetical protein EYF80_019457 [Liparis tanakae]|uniref:Uncharacterized protein n=1 Tax=Liparis tanakae TaxID=230148 RepID=A0A4Z2HZ39_9TELE|nr:hypothetical protein EYF80_019457 [Liparis tanakae]
MLLAAPLERTLPSAGICSERTQRGMEGWREEKTRTSLTPAMGEAWCCAGGADGASPTLRRILRYTFVTTPQHLHLGIHLPYGNIRDVNPPKSPPCRTATYQ